MFSYHSVCFWFVLVSFQSCSDPCRAAVAVMGSNPLRAQPHCLLGWSSAGEWWGSVCVCVCVWRRRHCFWSLSVVWQKGMKGVFTSRAWYGMSTYHFCGGQRAQSALMKRFSDKEIPTCSLHKTNKIRDGNFKEFDYSLCFWFILGSVD